MKKLWLIVLLSMALILTGLPAAYAQDAKAEFTLEEIVVTAERRESSAQDTPVAVSAWDYDAIEEQNISGITDLQMRMPSTFFSAGRITIRGVGRSSVLLGTDAGVGVFIDGFFSPNEDDLIEDLFDVERIENVRGPQSTLYGKSTIGGAINIIEKRPTKEWSGIAKARIGNYDRRDFQTAFGGPTPIENLYYRIGLVDKWYGGHTELVEVGDDEYMGTEDRWRMTGKLLYEPTDNLNVYFKYTLSDASERYPQANLANSYSAELRPGVIQSLRDDYSTCYDFVGVGSCNGSFYRNPYYGIVGENPSVADPYKNNQNTAPHRGVDTEVVDLTVSLDVGNFTFKYLGMYRDWETYAYVDYDWGPNPDAQKIQRSNFNSDEWSHELQVMYGGDNSRFNILGGLYWYDRQRADDWLLSYYGEELFWEFYYDFPGKASAYLPAFSPREDNVVYGMWYDVWDTSKAGYLQAEYDLTDTLTLSLGGRYALEQKKGKEYRYYQMMWTTRQFYSNFLSGATLEYMVSQNPGPWFSPDAAAAGAGHLTHQEADGSTVVMAPGQYLHNGFPYRVITDIPNHKGDWEAWLFHIGLDWKPSDETLFFGKIDRGFKPGGFGLTAFMDKNFESEFVLAYEIGWKQMWMDNRFSTIIGGFYYDYKDMQQTRRVHHDNIIDNASNAHNYGIEIEGSGYIIDNLLASLTYSYLNAEFDDYKDVYDQYEPWKGDQDLSGNTQPYSPEHKITLQGTYTLPTDMGDFSVHGLYFWQSEAYMMNFNIPVNLTDSYDRMDGELMWSSPNYKWRITLWLKNIFDTETVRYQMNGGPDQGFPTYQTYIPPRQFGIDIAFKW